MKPLVEDQEVRICPQPVFIVGSPRSGTSILAWSLNEHPDLWTSGESYLLFELFGNGKAAAAYEFSNSASAGSWLERGGVGLAEFLGYAGLGMNALFTSRSQGKRWVDHTPHYVLMADVLATMFPKARFLHILRDGRSVVHSMVNFARRLRQESKNVHLPPWATDFSEACSTWARYVDAGLDFGKRHPDRSHIVRNEDLDADPEDAFRRIHAFLGVDHDSGPVQYARTHRINSSFEGGNGGPRAVSEPWATWTDDEWKVFSEVAGETLARSGYAISPHPRMAVPAAVPER